MNKVNNDSGFYGLRISNKLKHDFSRKASKFGKMPDVLREIMQAFVDDRLSIQPDKTKESLYVTRK